MNDLTQGSLASEVILFNKLEREGEDVEKFLDFIEPCPKVEWAGEILRDRGFVVNANSDEPEYLQVTVFNPDYANLKFCNMASHRCLDGAFLSYRGVGDIHWSRVRMEINDGADRAEVDFASDCEEENPTVIDVTQIIGKVMEVQIGQVREGSIMNVYDVNGNSLDPLAGNISFQRTIASLDLARASTSFVISMDGDGRKLLSEEELKQNIVSVTRTDSSRVQVSQMKHVGDGKTTATVKILPFFEKEGRNLRVLSENIDEDSVHLFNKLWDVSEGSPGRRKLSEAEGIKDHAFSFVLSHMKVLPCTEDLEKFKTVDPALMKEEEELLKAGKSMTRTVEVTSNQDDHSDLRLDLLEKDQHDLLGEIRVMEMMIIGLMIIGLSLVVLVSVFFLGKK